MEQAGTPCPFEGKIGKEAKAEEIWICRLISMISMLTI